MPKAARMADPHSCPVHGGGPIMPAAPVLVLAEPLQAARLADYAFCLGAPDVVFEGASTVLVGGLPFCRVGDHTAHKGEVGAGATEVLVGGATFSLPANIAIKGGPTFQNLVIRDLYLLWTTPSGKELLSRLEKAGQEIAIEPESTPDNSSCNPANQADAKHGKPTGSTVKYNPMIALRALDASNHDIDFPPQVALGHEMTHALDNSEGRHAYGTDPSPPASQPDIEEEEAQAIGTGSHSGDSPTENSIRNDLNLPRRDNHYGDYAPGPTGDLRPGGY